MNSQRFQKLLFICLLSLLFILFAGCNQNSAPPNDQSRSAPPQASAGTPIDASTTGSISGTITFAGTTPPRATIDMGMDARCALAANGPTLAEWYLRHQDHRPHAVINSQ